MNPELIQLKQRLPINHSSFEQLIDNNCLYADKTKYIHEMVNKDLSYAFFFSRPCRFGKSLLLDTMAKLFECKEELFRGLYIYDKWDWDQKFSVVRLDLSEVKGETSKELASNLRKHVQIRAKNAYPEGIELTETEPDEALRELIRKLYKKYKYPVVVLMDEYDMPVINHVLAPRKAKMAKKLMHHFYHVLKQAQEFLHFVILTGISQFTVDSVFSGLNNLKDISFSPDYSAICGYTEAELDKYFAPFMEVVDREEFRKMYNGYNWLGDSVYNPVDVMLAINKAIETNNFHQFDSYWLKTGTPTFLVNLVKEQEKKLLIPNLDDPWITKYDFTTLDIEALWIEAFLFQTGYLSIEKMFYDNNSLRLLYNLKYPNKDVSLAYETLLKLNNRR